MEREQTTIRLPGELAEQLRQKAYSMGVSLNYIVIYLLRKALEL